MNLLAQDINWLHVELSSRCNAWCPACPRNVNGFGLRPDVVEQDLDLKILERVLTQLPNLHSIQLCGNLGDPIAAACINEAIDLSKKYVKKIQIHTNGSLRNTEWWTNLAEQLKDIKHDIWFGIDGLKNTHEIYRQGTDFNKIIANAQAFIDAGGYATWQFIPYKHNEHQVKDCLKLSSKLKFKKFKVAEVYRTQTLARHYRTGEHFDLLPTDLLKKLTNIDRIKQTAKEENCMHLSIPSIYLSASGVLSRCCYMAKFEKFDSVDRLLKETTNDLSNQVCIKNCG